MGKFTETDIYQFGDYVKKYSDSVIFDVDDCNFITYTFFNRHGVAVAISEYWDCGEQFRIRDSEYIRYCKSTPTFLELLAYASDRLFDRQALRRIYRRPEPSIDVCLGSVYFNLTPIFADVSDISDILWRIDHAYPSQLLGTADFPFRDGSVTTLSELLVRVVK